MKELRLDLDYLASTYGIVLDDARLDWNEQGEQTLVLIGMQKEKR